MLTVKHMNTYQTTRSELSDVLHTYQQRLNAIVAQIPDEQHILHKQGVYDLDANERGAPLTEATIVRMYRPVTIPDQVSAWTTVRKDLLVARNACFALASSYVHRFTSYIQSHAERRTETMLGTLQRSLSQEYAFSDASSVSDSTVSLRTQRTRILLRDYGSGVQSIPISCSSASVFQVIAEESRAGSHAHKHASMITTLCSALRIVLIQITGGETPSAVVKRCNEEKETPQSSYTHVSNTAPALRWV